MADLVRLEKDAAPTFVVEFAPQHEELLRDFRRQGKWLRLSDQLLTMGRMSSGVASSYTRIWPWISGTNPCRLCRQLGTLFRDKEKNGIPHLRNHILKCRA